MPIPIVLVWGQRDSLGRAGWTARRCSRCQRVQAFHCYKRTREHHLYFVNYASQHVGHVLVCDVCEGADAVDVKEALRMDASWRPEQGLEALAKSTEPSLLPVEPRKGLSNLETLAILRTANETGQALSKDVTAPFWRGGIPGGILSAAVLAALRGLGALPRSVDALGWGMLGLMLGGLAAGLFMAVRVGQQNAQRAMRGVIDRALARHRITLSALRAAATSGSERFRHVERILPPGAVRPGASRPH